MFQETAIIGSSEKKIVLQTAKGKNVENLIEDCPSDYHINIWNLIIGRHPDWRVRRLPCGVYNCAGHVFANRRTSILEECYWHIIFEDDGYRKLAQVSEAAVGDLVVYWDTSMNSINHIGMIMRLEESTFSGNVRIPWILSKWNSAACEVIHSWHDHPFDKDETKIEFWTERPI